MCYPFFWLPSYQCSPIWWLSLERPLRLACAAVSLMLPVFVFWFLVRRHRQRLAIGSGISLVVFFLILEVLYVLYVCNSGACGHAAYVLIILHIVGNVALFSIYALVLFWITVKIF